MLNLDDEVRAALSSDSEIASLIGSNIYEPNDPGKEEPYNAVFYEEISNVPAYAGDDKEKASRITYQMIIYRTKKLAETVNAVERVMISLGFARHSVQPMGELPAGVKGKKIYFVTEREVDE